MLELLCQVRVHAQFDTVHDSLKLRAVHANALKPKSLSSCTQQCWTECKFFHVQFKIWIMLHNAFTQREVTVNFTSIFGVLV